MNQITRENLRYAVYTALKEVLEEAQSFEEAEAFVYEELSDMKTVLFADAYGQAEPKHLKVYGISCHRLEGGTVFIKHVVAYHEEHAKSLIDADRYNIVNVFQIRLDKEGIFS